MTEEQYKNIQEEYIEHILEYVKESGGLFPHISIFADIIQPKEDEKDKPALIHIPIDDKFMENDETKDEFVNDILPDVFKSLKERFIPMGVAWAAEAWMRVPDKGFDPAKDNWKGIQIKKEIIMISIESENHSDCFIYEIRRNGKQVTSEGEIIDTIVLEKLDDLSGADKIDGRFSGLFKKFNK